MNYHNTKDDINTHELARTNLELGVMDEPLRWHTQPCDNNKLLLQFARMLQRGVCKGITLV